MGTKDYEWFVKADLSDCAGKWVATLDQRVVAHGNDAELAYKEAKAKYPTKKPSLAKIPTGDILILAMQWTRLSLESPTIIPAQARP